MLRNLINNNKKTFELVVVVLCGIIVLLSLVSLVFDIFKSTFFSIIASALNTFVFVGLLGALAYTILVKKENLAKVLGVILLLFWVVNNILSFASPISVFATGNFVGILYAIFEFLANLSLLACVVLYAISNFMNKDFEAFINYGLIAHLGLLLFAFVFRVIHVLIAKLGFTTILTSATFLCLSVLAVIGFFLLDNKSKKVATN